MHFHKTPPRQLSLAFNVYDSDRLLFGRLTRLSLLSVAQFNNYFIHSLLSIRSGHNVNQSVFDSRYNIVGFSDCYRIIFEILAKRQLALRVTSLAIDAFQIIQIRLRIIIYMIFSYLIGYHFGLLRPYKYPMNIRNITGTLAFQLLLTGPSEEILFRALPITILAFFMRKDASKKVPIATTIAAALFSIAHINWYTGPFRIEYDIFQLGYAFAIGIVQGLALQKTGSIYYSMAIHSISNIISVGSGYLVFSLML